MQYECISWMVGLKGSLDLMGSDPDEQMMLTFTSSFIKSLRYIGKCYSNACMFVKLLLSGRPSNFLKCFPTLYSEQHAIITKLPHLTYTITQNNRRMQTKSISWNICWQRSRRGKKKLVGVWAPCLILSSRVTHAVDQHLHMYCPVPIHSILDACITDAYIYNGDTATAASAGQACCVKVLTNTMSDPPVQLLIFQPSSQLL